jgi:predicted nucleic acid-binding protein
VEAALTRLPETIISPLVALEFASAIARKTRMRELPKSAGREALALFRKHEAEQLYRIAPVTTAHYAEARSWLERLDLPLRALDAIHLAVAHAESALLLTADATLAQAAGKIGLQAELVSR